MAGVSKTERPAEMFHDVVLAIHGGAGGINRQNVSIAAEKRYIRKLEETLLKGWELLQEGRSAVDVVEAAVKMLEESPLFNAGRGSVFSHDGKIEMDASIMEGTSRAAGAVAGVTTIKHPISAARAVMEKSRHVLLAGRGAERFARKAGLTIVDPAYFWTKQQWERLQKVLREERAKTKTECEHKYGTVGAVACDQEKHLASGTSSGGTLNKQWGRVGDSPLIGAGTYADNSTCAVSCTGHGEYFIRFVAAYDVVAHMKYAGLPLDQAAHQVVFGALAEAGGRGGLIGIDASNNCVIPFNSEGMFRGYITRDGKTHVAIFGS